MCWRCIPEHAEVGIPCLSLLPQVEEEVGQTPPASSVSHSPGSLLAASDLKERGRFPGCAACAALAGKDLAAPPQLPDSSCPGGLIWCRSSSEFKSHLILPTRTKEKIPLFLLLAV